MRLVGRDKERRWSRKHIQGTSGLLQFPFTIVAQQCWNFFSSSASRVLHSSNSQPGFLEESGLQEPQVMILISLFFFFPYYYYLHCQQVSHRSTFPQPSPSSVRRTTVSPVKPRRAEGRTGMTSRTSGRGRTAATARTQPAVPRPAQQSQEKNKVKSQDQDDGEGVVLFQPVWTARFFHF